LPGATALTNRQPHSGWPLATASASHLPHVFPLQCHDGRDDNRPELREMPWSACWMPAFRTSVPACAAPVCWAFCPRSYSHLCGGLNRPSYMVRRPCQRFLFKLKLEVPLTQANPLAGTESGGHIHISCRGAQSSLCVRSRQWGRDLVDACVRQSFAVDTSGTDLKIVPVRPKYGIEVGIYRNGSLKILTSLIPPNAFFPLCAIASYGACHCIMYFKLYRPLPAQPYLQVTTWSGLLDTLSNSGPDPQRQRHHLSVG
jgi:hypothetical protein